MADRFSAHGRTPALGTWIKLDTTESVEIMADAGFDFVVIDLEHAPLGIDTTARMISLARAAGVLPLVRVPGHDAATIGRVLDAGAGGILVPHVDSADEARRVVSAMRFPPLGERGAGGTSRAGRWGLLPRAEYVRVGNEDVLCIPQLESEAAFHAAADILAVEGVDAVFLGAGDLSLSLGVRPADPRVQELLAAGRAAAAAAGKPCGAAAATAEAAVRAAGLGHQFVVVGNDATMLARTAHGLVGSVRAPNPLVGAWELVGYEVEDRHPLGARPLGRLLYLPDGHMSVQYMAGDRPLLATGNWRHTTDEEKLSAVRTYGGYSGRYTWHGDRVEHHVDACIHPNTIGQTLVRLVELTATELVMRTGTPDPTLPPTPVLRWRRL